MSKNPTIFNLTGGILVLDRWAGEGKSSLTLGPNPDAVGRSPFKRPMGESKAAKNAPFAISVADAAKSLGVSAEDFANVPAVASSLAAKRAEIR